MQTVPLAEASLRFHGYPRQVEGNPKAICGTCTRISVPRGHMPTTPEISLPMEMYCHFWVRPTTEFVIIASGDEVALEFDPSSLPPVRPGWSRDYFLYADGFAKDMDFYESLSDTVEPLPFHAMPGYPYGAGTRYPISSEYLRYRLTYNTRYISSGTVASYRARYPNRKER